jgi:hypothetical protein
LEALSDVQNTSLGHFRRDCERGGLTATLKCKDLASETAPEADLRQTKVLFVRKGFREKRNIEDLSFDLLPSTQKESE